jgi:hypothetical protein
MQTPLRAKRVVVEIRDPDTVQVIRDFLEPLGYTVEVEPELDAISQATDPLAVALAS